MMVTGATLALDFAAGVFAEMYIWKEYRNYHFTGLESFPDILISSVLYRKWKNKTATTTKNILPYILSQYFRKYIAGYFHGS